MHGQIAADAVTGSVIEINTSVPEKLSCERVDLRARRAVRKHRARNCDMAAQHARKPIAHFIRRLADGDRARHVRGAVFILRAGVNQQQIAHRDPVVGFARDAIMHNGTVRAGSGDGRKRDILQRAGLAAETFQRFYGVDLGQRAVWRFAIDPCEKPSERYSVALVCVTCSGNLGRIFDSFEQSNGVGATYRFAAFCCDQSR